MFFIAKFYRSSKEGIWQKKSISKFQFSFLVIFEKMDVVVISGLGPLCYFVKCYFRDKFDHHKKLKSPQRFPKTVFVMGPFESLKRQERLK